MAYSTRFDEALVFTSEVHRAQIRKGSGSPYITHLLGVASIVGDNGGTEDQVIGALLHDAIEDCVDEIPDIADQIEERFGENVREIVEGCTDAWVHPKPPWKERKVDYLERLRKKSPEHPSMLVSLGDKMHNGRSIVSDLHVIGDELWQRFRPQKHESIWYYRSLADIFTEKLDIALADEFARVVEEIEELAG